MTKVLVLDQDLEAIKKITQFVSQSKVIEKILSATDVLTAEKILEKDQPELVFLTPSFYKLFSNSNLVINKDFVLLVDQKRPNQLNAEAVKRCSAIMTQNASFLEFAILINSLKTRKIRGDQSKMRTVREIPEKQIEPFATMYLSNARSTFTSHFIHCSPGVSATNVPVPSTWPCTM